MIALSVPYDVCVVDIWGRSINNSSVTFRTCINIAGNYHSSPCTNIVHNLRTLYSGFGLRVLPTSLIHTNNRSNILPILLQHKYTLQLTNNSFHSNTDSLYIIPPAIHTANRIANQIVPLASKPIPQVPDNLSDSPDITLQPARDLHFGGQSESSSCLRMSHTPHAHPRFPMATNMSNCHIIQVRNNLMESIMPNAPMIY